VDDVRQLIVSGGAASGCTSRLKKPDDAGPPAPSTLRMRHQPDHRRTSRRRGCSARGYSV